MSGEIAASSFHQQREHRGSDKPSSRKVPQAFHEVFGETQTAMEVVCVLLFGAATTVLLALIAGDAALDLPLWRRVFVWMLVFDIAAGCIANFSRGTNQFYATRPGHRWVFIAIHVHPLAVAWLMGALLGQVAVLWAGVIGGAVGLNLLVRHPAQKLFAGLLLSLGLLALSLFGQGMGPLMFAVSILFLIKMLFAFAVDHYGHGDLAAHA